MANKPVLVVMAAGMGSRYGGLKQIDPVGSHGEAILDYSLFDAHEAGFETAVIIIKEAIRQDFMDTVGKRLEKSPLEIRYAFQELDKLPEGCTVPEGRVKPWGTGHAVLCAKDVIGNAPFAVINSDDYYGKEGYKAIYQALCNAADGEYCMVGYELGKTVTDNGYVARGVCTADEKGNLLYIQERTHIEVQGDAIRFTEDGENWTELAPDTIVSMNTWGFTPGFLKELETHDYDNVLVACHGGIMRALCGYLDEAPDGLRWERAKNCEIRVYEYKDGHHTFLKSYSLER